jgi:hypothetical protein
MSQIEKILIKAHKKGIYKETMMYAQHLQFDHPKMEQIDRFEKAYKQAKLQQKTSKSS